MQLFYIPQVSNQTITLSEEESKHCIRVLRMGLGDQIQVVDGKGNLFICTIVDASPKRCIVSIIKTINNYSKRNFYLHIAIAPTKNIDRFEWFLEKATEIGIDEITPMLCEHSERKLLKLERLERVMVAAMKQSVKATLPILNPMRSMSDVLKNANEQTKLIAYCGNFKNQHAKNIIQKEFSTIFLIGPEGDFSISEVQQARNNGFILVGLGQSRLRTETAGVMACAITNIVNDIN